MDWYSRIVCVGDMESVSETLEALLEERNRPYDIVTRETAEDALDTVAVADCIVSTQSLPDGSGLSFLETIREEFPTLPFVLVASEGSERLARNAVRANVTEYISRSVTAEADFGTELAASIERALDEYTTYETRMRKLDRFRLAVEQAGQSIYMTDAGGVIQYVNPSFEELIGYTAEEAVGETPELFHPHDADEEWWSTMWAEEPRRGEVRITCKFGETIMVDQTVAPIMDEHRNIVEQFVVVQQDVTQQKDRERHLEVLNRLFRHNVRNSLTKILTSANTSTVESKRHLTTQLDNIEAAAEELLSLSETAYDINQLLLEREDSIYRFEVDAVLETIATRYRRQYPDAEIQFSTPGSVEITGHSLLERGFSELVDNAIVHNDSPRPAVEIDVERRAETVVVRIDDDGSGLPASEAEILTDNLEITQLNHGSGLGLWLVYWAVRKSGGEVSVPKVDERGTTIRVDLPLLEESADDAEDQYFESEPTESNDDTIERQEDRTTKGPND